MYFCHNTKVNVVNAEIIKIEEHSSFYIDAFADLSIILVKGRVL